MPKKSSVPNMPKNLKYIWGVGFLIIVCFGGFFGCKFFANTSPHAMPPDSKVVETEYVSTKDIGQTARFIGTLRPKRSTTLIAKTNGTLESLLHAGQKVSKGTLIAKIDNKDIEKRYRLSESAEKIAKTQYERAKKLLDAGLYSKSKVEDQKNIWIEAQKSLSHAKIELDKIQFQAPFNGIVGVFKAREGAQIQEGDPIVSFYDPSNVMVEFDVPASLINLVHEGQSVQVNGKTYALNQVQKMVDEETHMCPAYVNIGCDTCVIGSTMDVDLSVQKKDAIVIPYESVFLKDGKTFVYIVHNNKTVLTPVELGIREKEQVEITSGLTPGQEVIICGHTRLYPDMPVKIYSSTRE